MLPNHSPLMVAEAFGTLATLFPDRIDLGPRPRARHRHGDRACAAPLHGRRRRHLPARRRRADRPISATRCPAGRSRRPRASARTSRSGSSARASSARSSRRSSGFPTPSRRISPPASSRPRSRSTARPSAPRTQLAEPYLMLAFNVFAAETDAEGRRLRSSMQQAFVNLRTGRPGPLPRPVDDIEAPLRSRSPWRRSTARSPARSSARRETVRAELAAFIARHRPDETDPDRPDPRPCRTPAVVRDRSGGDATRSTAAPAAVP